MKVMKIKNRIIQIETENELINLCTLNTQKSIISPLWNVENIFKNEELFLCCRWFKVSNEMAINRITSKW
jgi:hypothetical protein